MRGQLVGLSVLPPPRVFRGSDLPGGRLVRVLLPSPMGKLYLELERV